MRQVRNAATITATDKNASASLFRIAVRFAGRLGQRACSDLRHMGMAAGVPIGRGPEADIGPRLRYRCRNQAKGVEIAEGIVDSRGTSLATPSFAIELTRNSRRAPALVMTGADNL